MRHNLFNNNVELEIQNEDMATHASKITTEMRKLNFNQDALTVYNQIRAFAPQPSAWFAFKNERIKIPHMGWNKVHLSTSHPLWNKIDSDSRFYFVHSFYAEVANKNLVMATSTHGEEFTCAIAKDNVFAVQFHPEKSSKLGLQLLKNFISWNI